MSLLTAVNSGQPILRPEQVGPLIIEPLVSGNLFLDPRVSTVVPTESHSLRVPVVTGDVNASWVAEGAEIPVTDAALAELDLVPAKLSGLTYISSELANDSSPAAMQLVGDSVVRDMSHKLDLAAFGSVSGGVAPAGLGSLATDGTALTHLALAGGAFTNLDPFSDAIAAAAAVGARLTSFVTSVNTISQLRKLKAGSGFNLPLVGNDDNTTATTTVGGDISIFGVPVLASPAVADDVVYGMPAARVIVALRQTAELAVDRSTAFTSDRVAIRATVRVTWGFPHKAAIVKIS